MFGNKWDDILNKEIHKKYFIDLIKFLKEEATHKTIYPQKKDLFKSLKHTDYDEVRVLILGQDPYQGEGKANGLCFSVSENIKTPPSLQNIFKELKNDLGITRTNKDLSDWAKQGVLLLNTVLTVEKGKPFSHRKKGWETFTDSIIIELNNSDKPIVFVFWGNAAREKKKFITNNIHRVIESTHPSPFSYYKGFKGSKPFSKINEYLLEYGYKKINW